MTTSRRTVLRGAGAIGVVVALPLASCGGTPASNLDRGVATMCGTNLCIDLANPANQVLVMVGGALLFTTATDLIIVIRTGEQTVAALSAICTHRQCTVDYEPAEARIVCPCHGSEFDEQGAVLRGPAIRPLPIYTATLAGDTITIALG